MKETVPFHVLCFAVFPVLALYVPNVGYTPLSHLFVPILVLLVGTLIVCGALNVVIRNLPKVGLIVSVGLLLFFTYGYIHRLFDSASVAGFRPYRDRYVFSLEAILFIPTVWFVIRAPPNFRRATCALNVISTAMVLTPTISIGYLYAKQKPGARLTSIEEVFDADDLERPSRLPDIFYIVLDGYGRSDVLKEYYGVDDGDLVNALREMGFYVADQATANYTKTIHSLTATLNLVYLGDVADQARAEQERGFSILSGLLKRNKVMRTFRELGYTVTTFASGWDATERIPADDHKNPGFSFTEFQVGLLSLTPVPAVLRELKLMRPLLAHRRRVLYVLDRLPEVANDGAPKFVFAHVLCPHFPYTFEADGGFQSHEPGDFTWNENQRPQGYNAAEYRELTVNGYGPQVRFLAHRIKDTIAQILKRSEHPPIIILQGDHGPDSRCHPTDPDVECLKEKFPILNAFYLPDGADKALYRSITPVNTFRVVFNQYFGASLELLPDRNYWSTYFKPFEFQDLTDEVQLEQR